jgi:hypothetical protein
MSTGKRTTGAIMKKAKCEKNGFKVGTYTFNYRFDWGSFGDIDPNVYFFIVTKVTPHMVAYTSAPAFGYEVTQEGAKRACQGDYAKSCRAKKRKCTYDGGEYIPFNYGTNVYSDKLDTVSL